MQRATNAQARARAFLGQPDCGAETFRHALRLAVEFAVRDGNEHITLCVPTLGHTQGDFDDVLGEPAAAKLRRNYRLTSGKLTLHLVTNRGRPHFVGPVVAAWAAPEQVRDLLLDSHCAVLIVVPWSEADVRHVLRFVPAATRF